MVTATTDESDRRTVLVTIILLLAFALAAMTLRHLARSEHGLPAGDSAWSIGVSYTIEVEHDEAVVSIPPPWDTQHARSYAMRLTHPDLSQRRGRPEKRNRDVVLVAKRPGLYILEADFNLHVSSLDFPSYDAASSSGQEPSAWLSPTAGVDLDTSATRAVIARVSSDGMTPQQLARALTEYVTGSIRLDINGESGSQSALTRKRATSTGKQNALIALLRTAGLPARIVTGADLLAPADRQPAQWTEVYLSDKWMPLDPVNGHVFDVPRYYIPFRKGGSDFLLLENASVIEHEWRIAQIPAHPGLLSDSARQPIDILDLNRLLPASREMLSVLLLLPLGALATQAIRQLAGVRTFGTFTPTLLALAATHVDLTTAIIVFALVIVIGVALRSRIPHLEMDRAQRLAIVFTLVAVSMAFVTSGLMYVHTSMEGVVVLLPTVILTMLVDKIYTVYDESGIHTVMVRLFWTVLSTLACLLILMQKQWGVWLLSYPEAHAVTLAAILLIGRYKGPRLRDLHVFELLFEKTGKKPADKTAVESSPLKS